MRNLYALILLLFILPLTALGYDELPDLGERSVALMSPKKEKQLGKEFMKAVRASVPILDDAIINDYITNLGNTLTAHANAKNRKFHFFIVKDSAINAFAGPDAHIGINSGTIIATESESELAAVMSHEIAHITQHHIERLIDTAKNTQIVALAGTLAAVALGVFINDRDNHPNYNNPSSNSNQNNSFALGVAAASIGGATQHMINFTKTNEIEADNIGMKILYNSAFDPNAMAKFFTRMQRLTYSYVNEVPQFLLTHPVTNDRIAESKNRADQYNYHDTGKKSQDRFNLIRMRTKIITAGPHSEPYSSNTNHKNDKSLTIQYGHAINLYQKRQFTAAAKIVAQLQKDHPREVLFQMLAAQLAVANNQVDSAINMLKTAINLYPDYYPLTIQYGQTLATATHFQAACDFIKSQIMRYSNTGEEAKEAELYQLLAKSYAKMHRLADAYQAKAKAYEIDGYNRQAIVLLQQALKVPQLSTSDRAIINARIDRLKKAEKDL